MSQKNKEGKPVSASKVEMTELVLPGQTNTLGNIFGGRVMQLIDIAAGVTATRHARKTVVTVFIDQLHFKNPIKMGQIVILHSRIEYAGNTSMEIGVDVFSENPLTGKQIHATTAHLTFVALNQKGKPTSVPHLILETDLDKKLFEQAKIRKQQRMREEP